MNKEYRKDDGEIINPEQISGFVHSFNSKNYKIWTPSGFIFANALGALKQGDKTILIGDHVLLKTIVYENIENDIVITKILNRKNSFIRPKVANIDNAFIITSLKEPNFNEFYLNKLITFFQNNFVKPILIFTKFDLLTLEEKKNFKIIINEYKDLGYKILLFKNKFEKRDINSLKDLSYQKLNLLVGQTGVGKSTILNFLLPNLNLRTQEISKFLGRGKHTTTNSTVLEIFDSSFFIDSPGFSQLNLNLSKRDISNNFLNFSMLSLNCRYRNCLHQFENGCSIKDTFNNRLYNIYLKLLNEDNKS